MVENNPISESKSGYGSTEGVSSSRVDTQLSASFREAATAASTLMWEDIWAVLPPKKKFLRPPTHRLEILRGISGVVQPGSLLAIMGASGSGKTTLLNVLTNRNVDQLELSGQVKVNGASVGLGISSISAYVQQEDLFVGVLTVKQHLWFQAMLRMDQSATIQQRQSRVRSVIRELGLASCQDSIIGIPSKVKSLSGGERKRLAFASEILMNPSIMFCDEPTSGLDSFMAESVVHTLKTLADRGKTIVCTIHQPSSEIFALFNNLLLLAEGRVMFMGSSEGAREFFHSTGYGCPANFNPADFYIRTLAVAPGKENESRGRLDTIREKFICSDEGKRLAIDIKAADQVDGIISPGALIKRTQTKFKASYLNQLRLVGWRSFLASNKDTAILGIRVAQNIFISLLTGIVFLNQPNDQKGVQNINGALFLMATNMTFGNAFTVITTFTNEMPLFKRDNENGTYRTSVYYLCKSVADLPVFLINPIIFSTIIYWMIGLKPDFEAYLINVATAVLLTNIVVAFGSMVSCIAGDPFVGMALAGPLLVPFTLFGGFLLNDSSVPVYFYWLEYLSWFKYANEIFFINQWHNFGAIGCEYSIPNSTAGNGTASSRCFLDGEAVLQAYSYDASNLTVDFIAMACLFIGFRLLGFVALYLRRNPLPLFGRKKSHGTHYNAIA